MQTELIQEFDRQIENFLHLGYPKVAGKTDEEFHRVVAPLREIAQQLTVSAPDFEKGYLPFVIVIKDVIPTATLMSLVQKDGIRGVTKLYPLETTDFQVISEENIPDSMAYLLVDIDRGRENINLPPNEAMQLIREAQRHPLTINEGVAIVTHYPEFLIKNNCFSLLASRHPGDKRVPALWINSKKHPNLGWCWDGNPHTWLGSASCGSRFGSLN